MNSSQAFRADSVFFTHQSDHETSDVHFYTSNNFKMNKPIKCKEYSINDTHKIIKQDDKLVMTGWVIPPLPSDDEHHTKTEQLGRRCRMNCLNSAVPVQAQQFTRVDSRINKGGPKRTLQLVPLQPTLCQLSQQTEICGDWASPKHKYTRDAGSTRLQFTPEEGQHTPDNLLFLIQSVFNSVSWPTSVGIGPAHGNCI